MIVVVIVCGEIYFMTDSIFYDVLVESSSDCDLGASAGGKVVANDKSSKAELNLHHNTTTTTTKENTKPTTQPPHPHKQQHTASSTSELRATSSVTSSAAHERKRRSGPSSQSPKVNNFPILQNLNEANRTFRMPTSMTMTSHAPSLVVASNQHQGLFVYPDPALSIASSNQRSDDVTGDDVTCEVEVAGAHAEGDQVVAPQEAPAVLTVTKIPDADNTQQSAVDCEVEDSIKNSPRGEGEGSACVTPPPTCQT